MIEITNLVKHYKLGGELVKAVDDISFVVEDSEMISIIGSSGSGKSTLMHIIGGLDTPQEGSIKVDGMDLASMRKSQLAKYRNKKIGFVFQTFNLQSHLTAEENVELPLVFAGIPKKKRRAMAKESLIKVGLGDRLKHKPNELSGGQRQRASIARALVNSPSIILADEPTGNLDSKTGDLILQLLKDLNKQQKVTLIIVTHDEYVAKSCERIIQIKDGKISDSKNHAKLITE